VGQLLSATASIASSQGNSVAAAQITALNSLVGTVLNINNLNINLFGTTAGNGLFGMVASGNRDAALSAQVDALGLVSTVIGIGTANHAVSLNTSIVGIPISVGLIEPPSIGIGGVGTTAYNAQVRVFVDISINSSSNPTPSALAAFVPLFQLLNTSLNLPIAIDLIDGYGTLTSLDCSQAVRTAQISVTSTLMHLCVGNITNATAFSTTDPCSAGGPPPISFLTVLGIAAPPASINLPGLVSTTSPPLSFSVSAATPLPQTQSTLPNPLALGDTVTAIGNALMGVVDDLLSPSSSGAAASDASVAANLATQYLQKTISPTTGKYNVTAAVSLLQNGSAALNLAPLGTWTVSKGVPTPCGLLNTLTCAVDGPVWTGFTDSVTGAGQGTLGQILGSLLGGLVLNNCSGLVANLLTYNPCVANNLASYLQTSPTGLAAPAAAGGAGQTCGLLCTLLSPVVNGVLAPLLNGAGSLLSSALSNVLGIELGETDVTLSGLTCAEPRLVY
jgi:hypothetical protein